MTPTEQRELHDLVEQYAQAVDRADAAAVAGLFAADGELVLFMDPHSSDPTGTRAGRSAIEAAVQQLTRYVATHHTVSSHCSQVDGVHATGETLCTAHHLEDGAPGRHDRVLYIRYLDTFAREPQGWRFTRREVHVQWQSTLPVDH